MSMHFLDKNIYHVILVSNR